jgi:hypothetical protein
MPTYLKNSLPGLPEGIVAIRFDAAGPDDFEMYGDGIQKGPRPGSHSQVIVRPAPGYTFLWDAAKGYYRCVKMLQAKKRITAVFEVLNSMEHESLKALLGHPNLVSKVEHDITFRKLGKHAKKVDTRTLKLAKYMTSALPPAPPAKDWSAIQNLGVMLNDSLGCCVIAGFGHAVQEWNQFAGHPFVPSDDDIAAAYTAVGGYDPSQTDLNGNNPTDNGCNMIDALNFWRKAGLAGHKIGAYAELNVGSLGSPAQTQSSQDEIKQSIALFGNAYLGFALPQSVENKTEWDVDDSNPSAALPGSWGGHCVTAVAYDATGITVVSWGSLVKVSWAFVARYLEEAYGMLSQDFIAADGKAPNGFALAALNQDLSQVTA